MSEQSGVGSEESVSGELGERVRALVAAAEGMATTMRNDADAYADKRRREADAEAERRVRGASEQADALLAERLERISQLSDSIIERAEAVLERLDQTEEVRRQLEGMARALGDAAERVKDELGQSAAAAASQSEEEEQEEEHPMADQVRPLRPPSERVFEPRPLRPLAPAHVPREDPDTRLDDARLVALQMAVAGRTREEVGAHLRSAFDVGDPDPILDHVFAGGFPPSPPPVGA
ncbi:MAG TPA: hypothetical protein VGI67_07880 [Thermoleophilaceae bacterium]|jgi:hypothetical protein